jgi:tetratricopeptide (TPR) repeat protein
MVVRRFPLAAAVAAMLAAVVCHAQAPPATSPSNELARQFLRLARENLAHVDDEMLADMGNADVCAALASLGQVAEASKLAAGMKSYRAEAFMHIAHSQADQGDSKGATATLRQAVSTVPQAKPEDLDSLASAMARLGDLEGAIQAADRMPPSSYRADLLPRPRSATCRPPGNRSCRRTARSRRPTTISPPSGPWGLFNCS